MELPFSPPFLNVNMVKSHYDKLLWGAFLILKPDLYSSFAMTVLYPISSHIDMHPVAGIISYLVWHLY